MVYSLGTAGDEHHGMAASTGAKAALPHSLSAMDNLYETTSSGQCDCIQAACKAADINIARMCQGVSRQHVHKAGNDWASAGGRFAAMEAYLTPDSDGICPVIQARWFLDCGEADAHHYRNFSDWKPG